MQGMSNLVGSVRGQAFALVDRPQDNQGDEHAEADEGDDDNDVNSGALLIAVVDAEIVPTVAGGGADRKARVPVNATEGR